MNQKFTHQKKYFNKIATSYHEEIVHHIKSIRKFYQSTKNYINGDVLDIGSGGVIGYDIKKAKKVIIADIAPEMLDKPLRFRDGYLVYFPSKKIVSRKANVLSMPFKNDSFDTTIMVTTAHHLSVQALDKTKNNIITALYEINRVTKTNGIFIIHECFYNPVLKFLQEIFFEPAYFCLKLISKPLPYFMSHKQLTGFLKGNGFEIIKIVNTPSSDKVYLPVFPSLSPPGWLWDKILRSDIFICRKIRDL